MQTADNRKFQRLPSRQAHRMAANLPADLTLIRAVLSSWWSKAKLLITCPDKHTVLNLPHYPHYSVYQVRKIMVALYIDLL